jgi:hypothetical protein
MENGVTRASIQMAKQYEVRAVTITTLRLRLRNMGSIKTRFVEVYCGVVKYIGFKTGPKSTIVW